MEFFFSVGPPPENLIMEAGPTSSVSQRAPTPQDPSTSLPIASTSTGPPEASTGSKHPLGSTSTALEFRTFPVHPQDSSTSLPIASTSTGPVASTSTAPEASTGSKNPLGSTSTALEFRTFSPVHSPSNPPITSYKPLFPASSPKSPEGVQPSTSMELQVQYLRESHFSIRNPGPFPGIQGLFPGLGPYLKEERQSQCHFYS